MVEMLIQRASSNATAHGLLASLTTNISYAGRNILQKACDFILRFLQICLRWIVHWSCQAIATLWRALRIPELLQTIRLIVLQFLKWCGIALAIATVICIGYWGLFKLLEIRVRKLEDRRQEEKRKRIAAYQSELRARQAAKAAAMEEARLQKARDDQAAKAAAMEEARLQKARDDQAIKDKLKRDEEMGRTKARADYMSWKQKCDSLFRDKASMTEFPFPPLPRCTDTGCPSFLKNPAAACQHNVKQFFKGSGNSSLEIIKRQRLLWHEDRFISCPVALRPEFKRLANSLFVVLDPWYEALKQEQANPSSFE